MLINEKCPYCGSDEYEPDELSDEILQSDLIEKSDYTYYPKICTKCGKNFYEVFETF